MMLAEDATAMGNPQAASDGVSGAAQLYCATLCAIANVEINAASLKDESTTGASARRGGHAPRSRRSVDPGEPDRVPAPRDVVVMAQNSPTVRPSSSMSTFMNAGVLPEPGHPLHVAAERDDEPGSRARHQRRAPGAGIPLGRFSSIGSCDERQMGLRHAHRHRPEPERVHPRQVLLGLRQEVDAVGAVQARGDRLDLLLERRAVGREEVEVVRLLARLDDGVRQLDRRPRRPARTLGSRRRSPPRPPTASSSISATSASVSVGKLLIDTTHGSPYSLTMFTCAARLSAPRRNASRSSFARSANAMPAVGLRRADGRHQHGGARREPPNAADDVAELLEAEVAREPAPR